MAISNDPKVSVVIPCYNAARHIEACVDSILRNAEVGLEVIVVDDGSIDDSSLILRDYVGQIICESGPNRGACAARNRGLALSRAPLVLFCDADDRIEPGTLGALVAASTGADLVLGQYRIAFPDGRAIDRLNQPGMSCDPQDILVDWLDGYYYPPCAVLWSRDFVKRIGGWDESFRRNDDGELIYRALPADPQIARANAGLSIYVQHESPDRVSRTKGRAAIEGEISMLDALVGRIGSNTRSPLTSALGRAYYSLAGKAYYEEAYDLGGRAMSAARACGLRGHPGSVVHTLGASVLGLKLKQRLARRLRHW